MKMNKTLACVGAVVLLAVAPAVASAQYRGGYDRGARYDRGERFYGRGYDRGYDRGHFSHSSRSNFGLSFGFGSRSYGGDYSYARFGYSSGPRYYSSGYYHRPVYAHRPVYIAPPVYVAPPVYYAPAYCPPTRYYSSGYDYGYARPRAYYYSTGSYYYCR